MGSYKVEQRRLMYRGREFHFVSYEGKAADPKRKQDEVIDAWFLMSSGQRVEVTPHRAGEEPADVDRRLLAWLSATMR